MERKDFEIRRSRHLSDPVYRLHLYPDLLLRRLPIRLHPSVWTEVVAEVALSVLETIAGCAVADTTGIVLVVDVNFNVE